MAPRILPTSEEWRPSYEHVWSKGLHIGRFSTAVGQERANARARLASAAPDLLRELRAVEWTRHPGGYDRCPTCTACFAEEESDTRAHREGCTLDAAIRKAEGR